MTRCEYGYLCVDIDEERCPFHERDHWKGRVVRLEEALREFDTWSTGYLDPHTGMGAGLHVAMWPLLTPSAAKKMRELARSALEEPRHEG